MSDLTYRISWEAADSYAAPAGLLTTFTTADNGLALAELSDPARIDRVRHELATAFPESPGQLAGPAATMAWTDEPFTRGGYAVYKPNQLGAFWNRCARAPTASTSPESTSKRSRATWRAPFAAEPAPPPPSARRPRAGEPTGFIRSSSRPPHLLHRDEVS